VGAGREVAAVTPRGSGLGRREAGLPGERVPPGVGRSPESVSVAARVCAGGRRARVAVDARVKSTFGLEPFPPGPRGQTSGKLETEGRSAVPPRGSPEVRGPACALQPRLFGYLLRRW
jgi:hypothetical protein